MHLDVLFRTVLPAPANVDVPLARHESVLRSLCSLILSIEATLPQRPDLSISLAVFDDHSSQLRADVIRNLLQDCEFPNRVVVVSPIHRPSLEDAMEFARQNCRDMVYFVTGDYLHHPSTFFELVDAYAFLKQGTGRDVVVCPHDEPSYYDRPFNSMILRSPHRYWRSVISPCSAFLLARRLLDHPFDERTASCFSAMPSLLVHIRNQKTVTAPLVDDQTLWDSTKSVLG